MANLNWLQITINRGVNVLAWKKNILRRAEEKLRESPRQAPKQWDGRTGARIIEVLALVEWVGPIKKRKGRLCRFPLEETVLSV
ncbi:MAG TPA: hypothetical protein VFS12_06650 [Terriglobia bacterium]|nr:hypothetical protein [Terriglobia bacterium]